VDSQEADRKRGLRLKLIGIAIGIIVVIPIVAWKLGFFG
jgi:hypothetical protein